MLANWIGGQQQFRVMSPNDKQGEKFMENGNKKGQTTKIKPNKIQL